MNAKIAQNKGNYKELKRNLKSLGMLTLKSLVMLLLKGVSLRKSLGMLLLKVVSPRGL